jgi:hypothetical protein
MTNASICFSRGELIGNVSMSVNRVWSLVIAKPALYTSKESSSHFSVFQIANAFFFVVYVTRYEKLLINALFCLDRFSPLRGVYIFEYLAHVVCVRGSSLIIFKSQESARIVFKFIKFCLQRARLCTSSDLCIEFMQEKNRFLSHLTTLFAHTAQLQKTSR